MSRVAWVALLLALLVPARAAALCCVTSAAESGPGGAPHGTAHHAAGDPAPDGPVLSTAAGGPDCRPTAVPAPALRERGPADDGAHLVPAAPPAIPPPPAPRPAVVRSAQAAGPEGSVPLARPLRI